MVIEHVGVSQKLVSTCLHDVGKSGVARLVEPEISRQDCGQVDPDGFQTAVNLPCHLEAFFLLLDLGGKHSLRPV